MEKSANKRQRKPKEQSKMDNPETQVTSRTWQRAKTKQKTKKHNSEYNN